MTGTSSEEVPGHLVTRTGGAGRLCHLRKVEFDEDDGRLKQGGAGPPGDSNWWCSKWV